MGLTEEREAAGTQSWLNCGYVQGQEGEEGWRKLVTALHSTLSSTLGRQMRDLRSGRMGLQHDRHWTVVGDGEWAQWMGQRPCVCCGGVRANEGHVLRGQCGGMLRDPWQEEGRLMITWPRKGGVS